MSSDPQKKPVHFWDALDAVLIINLEHRTDRLSVLMKTLNQWLPNEKIHRIDAVYGIKLPGYGAPPWFRNHTPDSLSRLKAGSAGCCLSHRKAIEYARDRGFKKVLILEDDVDFLDNLDGRKGEMIAGILNQEDSWDIFYLGYYKRKLVYSIVQSEEIDHSLFSLIRMQGPLYLHAYILNSGIYDSLLEGLPSDEKIWPWIAYHGSIDAWITNQFTRTPALRIWGTEPMVAVQQSTLSDITGKIVSPEEGQGIHRSLTRTEVPLRELPGYLGSNIFYRMHQKFKRTGRLLRIKWGGFR